MSDQTGPSAPHEPDPAGSGGSTDGPDQDGARSAGPAEAPASTPAPKSPAGEAASGSTSPATDATSNDATPASDATPDSGNPARPTSRYALRMTSAEESELWARTHGISPQARKRVTAAVWLLAAGMFVLGLVALPQVLPLVGMQARPELPGGEGQVLVSGCRPEGLTMQRCQGEVTRWTGEGPAVGDQVEVSSRRVRSGEVDVVRRLDYGTRSEGGRRETTVVNVFTPSDDPVLPRRLRPVAYGGYIVAWVLVTAGVCRLPRLVAAQVARRRAEAAD